MTRVCKSLIVVLLALSVIGGASTVNARHHKHRARSGPVATAQNFTWKDKPLWNVDGTLVDVALGYDAACLSGNITANITVPYGMTATLIQDDTPTTWTVYHSNSSQAIRVQANFHGVAGCAGQQVGIAITPEANSHSWDANTGYGVYNTAFAVTTT